MADRIDLFESYVETFRKELETRSEVMLLPKHSIRTLVVHVWLAHPKVQQ